MGKIYTIHDSLHGQIRLSLLEIKIISSDSFNRLHDVYQNSTAFLTFPSNRTKRFEHSLGTMKLVSDMFFHSILNADSKNLDLFLKIFQNEIFEMIKNSINEYDSLSNYLFEPPKKDFYPEVPNDNNNESDAVAIEGLLKEYENLNKTENISILRKIYTSSVLIEDKDYLGNIITKSIENSIKEDFKNIEFYDIIVVFKNIKVGLHSDKPITFYDGEELKTIQNISPIMNILSLETSYRPLFNIYILTENKAFINDNKEKLLQHAGITIAESLLKELVNELSQLKEEK